MKRPLLIITVLPVFCLAHDAKSRAAAPAEGVGDYVVKLGQMAKIEAGKRQTIHLLRAREHGFKRLSFILTQTEPGGGPPLHTHESEEARTF